LETRIEKLERRLQESQQRKASVVAAPNHGHDGAVQKYVPSEGLSKTSKRLEAQEIDDLVSDFGYLSVNPSIRACS
jgi:glycerate kinase